MKADKELGRKEAAHVWAALGCRQLPPEKEHYVGALSCRGSLSHTAGTGKCRRESPKGLSGPKGSPPTQGSWCTSLLLHCPRKDLLNPLALISQADLGLVAHLFSL